ncbi:hypothetical protein GGX14DRAFT_626801 [Mycena pura]|uniref:Uncharacterized protein n=1 Tax=Mycena pura TaxID=153505 RepID=A0AAD6YQL4_9AGAR|nr:hypothetical protein GGX14DRAFT_626801 [Mycena pura]
MHLKHNLFDTQELVGNIIGHVIDHAPGQSKRDLLPCALVARLWTYPAQSCIFRQLRWSSTDLSSRWPLLHRTLGSAPYLVQHIRRLCIFCGPMPTNLLHLFLDMCTFPFTHLEHADVSLHYTMPVQNVLAVRQLFGLTTLRSVAIHWSRSSYDEPFHRLWELCSPSIKHLALNLHDGHHPPPKSAPRRSQTPVIFLESLHIVINGSSEHALDDTPFSLGKLNKLSVASFTEPILWHPFARSFQSVQYLAFAIGVRVLGSYDTPSNPVPKYNHTPTSIDLSLLPNLVVLAIRLDWLKSGVTEAELSKVLSSINAVNQISTIIFQTWVFESSMCEKLDAKLSSLPMRQPPIVVLDMNTEIYSQWRHHMPTLRSSNLASFFLRFDEQFLCFTPNQQLRRAVADSKCSCCEVD